MSMTKRMTKEELQRAKAGLNGRTQLVAFETAKFLYNKDDIQLEAPLTRTLKCGRRPFNRAAAAYVMQMITTAKTVSALERTVSDKSEHPRVRGEAAEALAHAHRLKSHDVLLKNLADPNKDVRFWCAFALGEMAERRAIPALTQVAATDRRVIRGFHSVAQEAKDALKNIEVENTAHRTKNGCIFCRRL